MQTESPQFFTLVWLIDALLCSFSVLCQKQLKLQLNETHICDFQVKQRIYEQKQTILVIQSAARTQKTTLNQTSCSLSSSYHQLRYWLLVTTHIKI